MYNEYSLAKSIRTSLFLGFALLLFNPMAAIACQTTGAQEAPIKVEETDMPVNGIREEMIPLELVSPSPTPVVHAVTGTTSWRATPTMEERIWNSDLIVQAKLLTVEAKTRIVPSEEGVKPTYVPVVELVFHVDE